MAGMEEPNMPEQSQLRLPRRRLTEWILFAAGLLSSGAILVYMILTERASAIDGDAARMRAQALVIDQALHRQLAGVRSALDSARQALQPGSACDAACRHTLLQSLRRSMPGVRALLSIGPDGRIALSDDDIGDHRLDDRRYLDGLHHLCNARTMTVSDPFENAPGEFNIKVSMSRGLDNGCGRGAVSAILNPDYFDAVMRSALYAPDMYIAIADAGGQRLLYVPPDPAMMRRGLPDRLVGHHQSGGEPVSVTRDRRDDGVEQLVVQRSMTLDGLQIDRELVIALGRDASEVTRAWRRLALTCGIGGAAFWLTCCAGLLMAQARRRSLRALERAAELDRIEAAERVELALNGASLALWDWDLAGGRLQVDARGCAMLGYTMPEQEQGRIDWSALVHPEDADAFLGELERHQAGLTPSFEAEFRMRHRAGHWIWIQSRGKVVARTADGAALRMVGTRTDISARRQAEAEIAHLAFYDGLTKLPNRRLLMDRLSHALAKAERAGEFGAVLFVDLDNFKTLNDTLGHDMGDRLLEMVAFRLQLVTREADTVARLGGDEFVVLLEDLGKSAVTASATAEIVAQKVLDTLSMPYQLDGHELRSTPSIGVVLFGDVHHTIGDLLRQADMAMYEAKAAGRATFRFFDPGMQAAVDAATRLEADLRQALAARQFALHYQPVVDADGSLVGVEALIRWHHPQHGLVSPAAFIGQAEKAGLIVAIGDWVLEEACAQLAAWAAHPAAARLSVAVNVSAGQFHGSGFVDRVRAILERSGADPRLLKFELTESMLLHDAEDMAGRIGALRACGIGFALDDFGTGYSSLNYLRRLPLDQLKIDQSFVRDMLASPSAAGIVQAIVHLADSLGLDLVAEGVESAEQWRHLRDLGCERFQGFLFAAPMPAAELMHRYHLGAAVRAA
ncbi:EAL domain-containing protein [Massilia arenae]|uniref:EAL domain-containing protein n=2 Tax=Massilia arenae TaxID=2603288 RepID=A0A5C7G502_9BURK|nr:EAL domain-containing protein [Massilia arenae]